MNSIQLRSGSQLCTHYIYDMHPLHNCYLIKLYSPPDEQCITMHHNTERVPPSLPPSRPPALPPSPCSLHPKGRGTDRQTKGHCSLIYIIREEPLSLLRKGSASRRLWESPPVPTERYELRPCLCVFVARFDRRIFYYS